MAHRIATRHAEASSNELVGETLLDALSGNAGQAEALHCGSCVHGLARKGCHGRLGRIRARLGSDEITAPFAGTIRGVRVNENVVTVCKGQPASRIVSEELRVRDELEDASRGGAGQVREAPK